MSNGIKIWVDADACPGPVKDILFRAARRVKVPLILVANQRAVEAWKKFQASQATFMITRRQIKELEAAQKLLRQESEVAAQSA